MHADSLPQPLRELQSELEQNGFELAETASSPRSFGDIYMVFVDLRAAARFVRDRGKWCVEIGGPGGDQWFSPMVWQAYLDGQLGSLETPTLDEQCAFIRSRLTDIASAMDDPALLEELLALRATRAKLRSEE